MTLVFTDIEGSTRLLHELGQDGYRVALAEHRRIVREAFVGHSGYEVDYAGDAFFYVFQSAVAAVAAVEEAMRGLDSGPVRIRVGIHTGEPALDPPKYVGVDVHRAARLMSVGCGGQVLISQSTRDLLDERFAIRDLGEHRLKDLSQAQRLYQLEVEGLPSSFPALSTLENRLTNLPVQPTPLIGRERELADVGALLLRDEVRLLTLTGPGGTGKTRLALQAAAQVIEEFADGVYLVPLAPVKDAESVIATVAQSLGLREQAGRAVTETVHEHLRQKTLLLVLDNFEQVADAAPQVSALLAAAPRVVVLITSRSPVFAAGEHLYPVPTLTLPTGGADASVAVLLESEAVQLFVARARSARPDFEIRAENAAAIAKICGRLDGLPLAIELAAARSRLLSPQAMLGRFEQRLRLLTGGSADRDERQRTLRATIEWSYDLLTPAEQLLFARLGVFAGGCRLEAAEAVSDPDGTLGVDVFDGISSLLDKSLLRQRDDPDGEPRFWMLETIREYAQTLRVGGREEKLLADQLSGNLERDREELRKGTLSLLGRYDADAPNLIVALDHLNADGEEAQSLLRLIAAARSYWIARSLVRDGERWLELAVHHGLFEAAPPTVRAGLLDGAAAMAYFTGRPQVATERLQARLTISQKEQDYDAVAQIFWDLALVADELGRDNEAVTYFEQSLGVARNHLDDATVARVLSNYSLNALNRDDFPKALALANEAIPLLRAANEETHLTNAIGNRAWALRALNQVEQSLAALREASERSFRDDHLAGSTSACLLGACIVAPHDPRSAALLLGAWTRLYADSGTLPSVFAAEEYEVRKAECSSLLGVETCAQLEDEGRRMSPAMTLHLLQVIAGDPSA